MTPLHAILTAIGGIALVVAGVVLLWGAPVGMIVAGVCAVAGAVVLYDADKRGKPQ